jgi:hypothetical protein
MDLLVQDMKHFLDSSRSALVQYPAPLQEFQQRCDQFFGRLSDLCSSIGVEVAPLRDFSAPAPRLPRDSEETDAPSSELEW